MDEHDKDREEEGMPVLWDIIRICDRGRGEYHR